MSLWEARMLQSKGRPSRDRSLAGWLRQVAAPGVVAPLPLDVEVVLDHLPRRFHGAPPLRTQRFTRGEQRAAHPAEQRFLPLQVRLHQYRHHGTFGPIAELARQRELAIYTARLV